MQFLKSVNSHRKIDTVLALMEKYFYRLQSAKGVAKGLKGRSFELGLLTDIVAKYLLLKFGLTGANIIYRSGGKFFVLAPVRAQNAIASLRGAREKECYKENENELKARDEGTDKYPHTRDVINCRDFPTISFASFCCNSNTVFKF